MKIAETERLIIREIESSDLTSLAKVLSNQDVMRYSFRGVCSPKQIENYIEDCQTNYKQYGYGQWAVIIKSKQELIGVCGLNPSFDGNKNIIHIATRFAVAYWGKGLASEALKVVLKYTKIKLKLRKLYTLVEPANVRSVKAVLNNDFKFEKETMYKSRALNYYVRLL